MQHIMLQEDNYMPLSELGVAISHHHFFPPAGEPCDVQVAAAENPVYTKSLAV